MKSEIQKKLNEAYCAYNDENVLLAIDIYKSIATNGSAKAIIELIYIYGGKEFFNDREMNYWKDKLIDISNFDSVAQLGLANLYFEGFFGELDMKMGAFFLFKSAASNGDAQYQLADLYYSGLNGFSISTEDASYWLRRAYKNRNASAYYQMSRYYRNINQTKKSRVLLEKSAALGLGQAKDVLKYGYL